LRAAATLGAAALVGRLGAGEGGLLAQGIKMLGTSPELEKVTERVRGELLEVGKAAAKTATSRQIDSLSDKLHERAESMRGVSEAPGKLAEQATGGEAERAAGDEEGGEDGEAGTAAKPEGESGDEAEAQPPRKRARPIRRMAGRGGGARG
jgi:hypothetical protein